MFELRNSNQVWYKSEDMYEWIHYGNVQLIDRKEESNTSVIYEIKKFNFQKEQYEVDLSIIEYEYGGIICKVTGGCFEVLKKPEVIELSEREQSALETSINVDYLVCLADLGV